MTKCIMRELEDLGPKEIALTLKEAKRVVKESCKHSGGILPPDECIKNFVGKKNEPKVFVCTNDEDLRNELRNLGVVPIFFFKYGVLVMDSPTEITEEKHRLVQFCFQRFLERIIEKRTNKTRKNIYQGSQV